MSKAKDELIRFKLTNFVDRTRQNLSVILAALEYVEPKHRDEREAVAEAIENVYEITEALKMLAPRENPPLIHLPKRGNFLVTAAFPTGEDKTIYQGRDPEIAEKKAREHMGSSARISITDPATGNRYWDSRRLWSR